MPKIAFLGAGRMASAIVDGLLAQKICPPEDLACADGGDGTAAALAARTRVNAPAGLSALLASADTIVLACKPQQLGGLDPRVAELTAGKLVLSILAGKRLARLAQVFPRARNIVRAMPNTPGQIGAGITAWCSLHLLVRADRATVDAILGALGTELSVTEPQLDAVAAG